MGQVFLLFQGICKRKHAQSEIFGMSSFSSVLMWSCEPFCTNWWIGREDAFDSKLRNANVIGKMLKEHASTINAHSLGVFPGAMAGRFNLPSICVVLRGHGFI